MQETYADPDTVCEVCEYAEPLTASTFCTSEPLEIILVCAGCVEAWEQMEADDPSTP